MQNDRTNYEERQRRAEAKRREEEAKRKAELEERQRLREERAKKAGAAAKLPAKPAAAGDGLRAKNAASRVAKVGCSRGCDLMLGSMCTRLCECCTLCTLRSVLMQLCVVHGRQTSGRMTACICAAAG